RGLTPTSTQWFEWGKKDFSGTINNLYEADSKVIIYVGNPVEATKIIEQISLKQTPLPIISHWGITGGYFPQLAGNALNKVDLRVLQTFSFIDNNNAKVLRFVEKYKARYSITKTAQIVAPVGTAHAYDLMHLLAKAIKKAGSTAADDVRQALETLEYHSGLVKEYAPPFTPQNHDALNKNDFIMTHYEGNHLVPLTSKAANKAGIAKHK
ncbi:MAG: ABC transporter substrate-binding protein, partial [Algicola sp.]|nr:ABC transporter substrate-binding protein [Algicola sp.]